jgi:hypothetical protein
MVGEHPTQTTLPGEVRENDCAFVYLDVDDPRIAWLAYRGMIASSDNTVANPGNISWHLFNTLRRGVTASLRREGKLEAARRESFPDKLSRLTAVYAYPTIEAAERGCEGRGKFRKENLVAIGPAGEYRREEYDSEWATNFDSLDATTAASSYWSGQKSKNSLPELLLQGRFWICGTSVRKRAYEAIKKRGQSCLAMLELARLAPEFGCDLGAIAPWLRQGEDGALILTSILKYDEAKRLDVFNKVLRRRALDKDFQVDWKALKPLMSADAEFSVPDFRDLERPLHSEKIQHLIETLELEPPNA